MIFVPNFIGERSRDDARLADDELLTPDLRGADEARKAAGRLVADLPAAPAS